MKTFLLTVLIAFLLATPAAAQGCGPANPQCVVPTAPPGTNNNQAASTAFVQKQVFGTSNTYTQLQTFTAGFTSAGPSTFSNLTSGGTQCAQIGPSGVLSGLGSPCGTGSGAVNSVTNADGTLTITPTTGLVVASLALGHPNTWTGTQTFNAAATTLNSGIVNFAGAINGSQVGDINSFSFTPPNFGGIWLTNNSIISSYSTVHSDSRTTLHIDRTASGSGTTGPGTADYGAYITSQKLNFLSSAIDGEIDGLSITVGQGVKGDAAPLLAIAQKVYAGSTGGVVGSEFTGRWIDTSGNSLMTIQAIPSFGEAAGGLSNNTGYGMWIENQGAAHAVAASQITPYSGYFVGGFDPNGNCPANCPTFANVFTAAGNRTTAHIFYQVSWGLNESGTITIGSPSATGIDGATPTLSGGSPVTIANINGSIALTPKVGGTIVIGGTNGVTCAPGTVNLANFTVTAGIVTRCN